MKRPLFWTGLCFLSATAAFLLFPKSFIPFAFVAAGCLLCLTLPDRKSGLLLSFSLLLGAAAFLLNSAVTAYRLRPFEGEATGTVVISEVDVYGGMTVLSGRAAVKCGGVSRVLPVRLTVWGGSEHSVGDTLSFTASVYRQREASPVDNVLRLTMTGPCSDNADAPAVSLALVSLRLKVCRIIRDMVSPPYDGLLCAMLAGERAFLDDDLVSDFRAAGISHLLVVSGMHLVVAAELARKLAARLREKASFAVMMLAVWSFALFTGFGVSVVRAAIMVTAGEISKLFLRDRDTLSSLMAAGILIGLFSPSSITETSFLLSFGAVFGIALFASPLEKYLLSLTKRKGRLLKAVVSSVSVSAAAQIGTLPVCAVVFGSIPVVGLIANVPSIPLMSPALLLGAVGVIVSPLRGLCGRLCELIVALLCAFARFFSSLPLAKAGVGERYVLFFILAAWLFAVVCRFIRVRKITVRMLSLSMAAVFLFCSCLHLLSERSSVTVACFEESHVLAVTKGSHAVIVGTPESGYEATRIVSFLESCNVAEIDAVVTESDVIPSSVLSMAEDIGMGGIVAPDTPANRALCYSAGLSLYRNDVPISLFGRLPLECGEGLISLCLDSSGKEIYPRDGLCVIIKEYSPVRPLADGILWQIKTPVGGFS